MAADLKSGLDAAGEHPCDNRFEAIIDSISDGVFAVDRDWRITCFNAAAERTLGVSREDAVGKRCSEVFRSNICTDACALRYTMETGRPIVNLPIQIRDAAGARVPVTVSTALLRDRVGKVVGGVETFRDLKLVRALLLDVERLAGGGSIMTADPRVKKLLDIVPTIARSESTVLIEGESGTGKGLLAHAIHESSARSEGPMVTVNCAALPETLLESELFGYRKGAFTGAHRDKPGRVQAAEGGTLFLDEIGDLPASIQVKLLRLLQEKEYEALGDVRSTTADVRIITATNRNLSRMVEEGTLRQDLYYRINVIRLEMPPLRERSGDIPLLAEGILRRLSATRGKVVEGVSRGALGRLMGYDYPGNVRELENILEHGYVLCEGRRIEEHDLPDRLFGRAARDDSSTSLGTVEAGFIRSVLARNRWSRTDAARELGIHRTTLQRKIRRLAIDLPPEDGRTARKAKRASLERGKNERRGAETQNPRPPKRTMR
jgi:PAS domain S-box-containing protein